MFSTRSSDETATVPGHRLNARLQDRLGEVGVPQVENLACHYDEKQRSATIGSAGVFGQQVRDLVRHLDALRIRPLSPGRPVRGHHFSCLR